MRQPLASPLLVVGTVLLAVCAAVLIAPRDNDRSAVPSRKATAESTGPAKSAVSRARLATNAKERNIEHLTLEQIRARLPKTLPLDLSWNDQADSLRPLFVRFGRLAKEEAIPEIKMRYQSDPRKDAAVLLTYIGWQEVDPEGMEQSFLKDLTSPERHEPWRHHESNSEESAWIHHGPEGPPSRF